MNNDDPQRHASAAASPSLCDLFARTLARQPDALALSDPLNKSRITGLPPSRLTYAEADSAIASLAAQMLNAGLPAGSIIALQTANTVEFPLLVLAAWRAGLVVALLPQLWRRAELSEALNRVGARAIVCASRIEIVDHAELAMNAAAEAFSIRHVFGIGNNLPDGMTPLDWTAAVTPSQMPASDARKAAIVSFDVTPDGLLAVPRNHVNLIAGSLAISMESDLSQGAKILSSMIPSSFAGMVSSMVMWLLTGGSLSLHHPFDPQNLENQIRQDSCDTLVAPAHLALRLMEAGTIDALPTLRHVVGLWRTPERVASSADWRSKTTFTDVYLFGEAGLFGARRSADGLPLSVSTGPYNTSRNDKTSRIAGEIMLTPQSTLALRGPMIAIAAYRPIPKGDASLISERSADYVDTGYAARRNQITGAIDITAPPSGMTAVGGYRFRGQDLDRWAARLASGTTLTALPDQLNGHRLAGRAGDNARVREALAQLGLNPLMTEAFRERGPSR